MKFAEPLKDMTRALLRHVGMTPEEIEQHVEGNKKRDPIAALSAPLMPQFGDIGPITSRFLQQTLGTDWGRDIVDKDFWVRVTLAKVTKLMSAGHSVVIDDLRFPNEYVILSVMGARLVKVTRPAAKIDDRKYEGQLEDRPFHFCMINDTSIEDLRKSASFVERTIRLGRRPR